MAFYVMSKIPFYHSNVSHFNILLNDAHLREGAGGGCMRGGALIDK